MRALPLLALAGCATVQVGGWTLGKDRWEYDRGVVSKRAAFELHCAEDLQLTVLAVYTGTITAQQIGVSGCGHRLVYVNSNDGWLLNSSDGVVK